jgi:hypothetical protein
LTAELVNEGLAGGPKQECTNDVCVDDIRQRVALPGEPVNVVPQGLARLLLAALEVLGVFERTYVPYKFSTKNCLSSAQLRMLLGSMNSSHARTCSPTQMGRYWMMK